MTNISWNPQDALASSVAATTASSAVGAPEIVQLVVALISLLYGIKRARDAKKAEQAAKN